MNSDTILTAEIRAEEAKHFFRIMSGLAAAKASNDASDIAEWADELEVFALYCPVPIIRDRAKAEAAQALAMVSEEAGSEVDGIVLVFARPVAAHVPLN